MWCVSVLNVQLIDEEDTSIWNTADKIIVSKMDVVRVRAKFIKLFNQKDLNCFYVSLHTIWNLPQKFLKNPEICEFFETIDNFQDFQKFLKK